MKKPKQKNKCVEKLIEKPTLNKWLYEEHNRLLEIYNKEDEIDESNGDNNLTKDYEFEVVKNDFIRMAKIVIKGKNNPFKISWDIHRSSGVRPLEANYNNIDFCSRIIELKGLMNSYNKEISLNEWTNGINYKDKLINIYLSLGKNLLIFKLDKTKYIFHTLDKAKNFVDENYK